MCEKKVFTEYCDKAPKDCKINSEMVVVIVLLSFGKKPSDAGSARRLR